MPDSSKSRPILIPPLVRTTAALEIVRERPEPHHGPEHPHCDEHFLFTPNCAACLEAERTQVATAHAKPIDPQTKPPKPIRKSSRSFGFTDNITAATFADPYRVYGRSFEDQLISELIDDTLDI
jgi:hypothetical protein